MQEYAARTAVYSFMLAVASLAIWLGLGFIVLVLCHGYAYMLDYWYEPLFIAVTGALGFAFGCRYKCKFRMLPVVIGWALVFAIIYAGTWNGNVHLWGPGSYPDVRIIFLSWLVGIPLAGILGTAVGRDLRQKRDKARAVFFFVALSAFVIYYRIALPQILWTS